MVARAYFHPTIDAIRPTRPKLAARLVRRRGLLSHLDVHALAESAPDELIVVEDSVGQTYTVPPHPPVAGQRDPADSPRPATRDPPDP